MSFLGTRLATAQTDGADHKTRFQELAAQLGAGPPRYEVEASGPDHARTFRVVAMLDGVAHGEGEGRTKKQAEQPAARAAVESLTTGGLTATPADPTIEPTGDGPHAQQAHPRDTQHRKGGEKGQRVD